MPSPFPGMDPYLEDESIWPQFQHQLVASLYQIVLPGLVDRYRARMHQRTYVTEEPLFTSIGRERGWPPTTRAQFDATRGPTGALVVGDAETVAEKILRVNEDLGGISRFTFQMNAAAVSQPKLLHAIELLATRVAPMVRTALTPAASAATT